MKINFDGLLNSVTKGAIDKEKLIEFYDSMKRFVDVIKEENYGFMKLPFTDEKLLDEIEKTAKEVKEKFENFVVVGIGGSNLGNIVLHSALNHPYHNLKNKPRIFFMDNPDPDKIAGLFEVIDPKKTCFNVITKSGSTAETMAAFLVLRQYVEPENIIATTDPQKGDLLKIAKEEGYKLFFIPPEVGGRFSVLTPVGLLSAAVSGIDIKKLIKAAREAHEKLLKTDKLNPAVMFAAASIYLFQERNVNMSILMPYSSKLEPISDWFRQLWAESLGKAMRKDGTFINWGQTPIKAVGTIDQHSQIQLYVEGPKDKLITFIRVKEFENTVSIPKMYENYSIGYLGGHTLNELIDAECVATQIALQEAGAYNIEILIEKIDEENIAKLFYLFEFATALAGQYLNINAFDQPGVEHGKKATYALLGRSGYEEMAKKLKEKIESKKISFEAEL